MDPENVPAKFEVSEMFYYKQLLLTRIINS